METFRWAEYPAPGEGVQFVSAIESFVVDVKRGGCVDAAAEAADNVFLNAPGVETGVQFVAEAGDVELQLGGILGEMVQFELVLMPEQQIVHFPELSLSGGGLGGLGGEAGLGMEFGQRKVPETELQLLTVSGDDLLHDRMGAPAMRALIVAVFDQYQAHLRRAEDVIARAQRQRERRSRAGLDHRANRLFFLQFFQRRQNPVRAGVDGDGRKIAPADDAFGIDNKKGPLGDATVGIVCAVLTRDGALGFEVGRQGDIEIAMLTICGVAVWAVNGNADEAGIEPLKFGKDFVIERELIAADGAPIGRIKSQDDGLTVEIGEAQEFSRLVGEDEIRSDGAGG